MNNDEIDFHELALKLWRGKWTIAILVGFFGFFAVLYSLSMPNIYRAETLLAPNQEQSSNFSNLATQYGGLASLAGISIGGSTSNLADYAIEVLRSRQFIYSFVENRQLLVELMAVKSWNPLDGSLELDREKYSVDKREWVRKVKPPKKAKPSLEEAYEEFRENLGIRKDKVTGFVSVTFDHKSPVIARDWLKFLIEDLNTLIMNREVEEARGAIAYLNNQIDSTAVSELRNVFFNLIQEEMKTIMLAKVTDEYVFRIIDPAIAPERKIRPRRSILVLIAVGFGAFLGALLALRDISIVPRLGSKR